MKRQMFGMAAGIGVLFMASGLVAGEKALLKWGADAKTLEADWAGKIKFEDVDGKLCGVVDNQTTILSKKLIPVEAGKKYILSGTFKSLGNEPSKVYYGFRCYGKNKRGISSLHSNVVLGTATPLAQACKVGDKTLVIKANEKWKINHAVAFNAKDDFSDLPNAEFVYKITKITPKGENMELQLSAAVKKAYPAGTKVRMHSASYGSYIYTTIVGSKMPKEWKTYSKSATLAKPGQMGWAFIRPGTAFVRVVILPNYSKKKDEKMAFTDLSLKVAE